MSGFDLADAERGVLVSAHSGRAAVVFRGNEVIAAAAAPAGAASAPGERTSLTLDGATIDVELTPLAEPVRLEAPAAEELTVCRAIGLLRDSVGETKIACLAVHSKTPDTQPEVAELRRSIAVAFADGSLLGLSASRPTGAGGHGDEVVSAALTEAGAELALAETLLSTEYDDRGRQRRATLEIWPQGEPPLRGAGTIVSGATVGVGELRVEIAFFRWSLNGRPGLGRYEIVTRR